MVNSSLQETRTLRLLPFERKHFGKAADGTMKKLPKASFMPSPEEVMNYLIPQYAKGIIYGAMVEAFCCEQQSRMTAMDAATTSAKDMIKDLSLLYNRARQAAITQEITEVCGGAASLVNDLVESFAIQTCQRRALGKPTCGVPHVNLPSNIAEGRDSCLRCLRYAPPDTIFIIY